MGSGTKGTFPMARATATKVTLQPASDPRRGRRLKHDPEEVFQSPTTGRNTRQGKKVEKPDDPAPGGPSGQKVVTKHDKKHTNK